MDYSKFKYRQSKKSKQKVHAHQTVKEIRMRPKTDEHDMDVKIKRARKFLEKGHKVMLNMLFRGRERAHVDFAQQNMQSVVDALADIAKVEQPARMAGRGMNMLLSPIKGHE